MANQPRIRCEWTDANGEVIAYLSSTSVIFQTLLLETVAQYGAPTSVRFFAAHEGYVHSDDAAAAAAAEIVDCF
jgi:hypothetical protein